MASSKFAKEVVSRIKGDDAEVLASKIERKAKSALRSQINSLEARKVDLEQSKEDADLGLENTIYTDKAIVNGEDYIKGIKYAQERLDLAASNLEAVEEAIEFWEDILDTKFDVEEEA